MPCIPSKSLLLLFSVKTITPITPFCSLASPPSKTKKKGKYIPRGDPAAYTSNSREQYMLDTPIPFSLPSKVDIGMDDQFFLFFFCMIFKHFISYLFSSLCVALHCFFWAQRVSSGILMYVILSRFRRELQWTWRSYKHLPSACVNCKL